MNFVICISLEPYFLGVNPTNSSSIFWELQKSHLPFTDLEVGNGSYVALVLYHTLQVILNSFS